MSTTHAHIKCIPGGLGGLFPNCSPKAILLKENSKSYVRTMEVSMAFLAPGLGTGPAIKVRRTAGSLNYLDTRQGWSSRLGQREAGEWCWSGRGRKG